MTAINSVNIQKRLRLDKEERVDRSSFKDGFTKLATEKINSSERLVVSSNERNVTVVKSLSFFEKLMGKIFHTKTYNNYKEENKHTVQSFKRFLIEEYGEEKVRQTAFQFRSKKIDLDTLISNDKPLTPEIVYLYNIGVNNIEQQDIDRLKNHLQIFSKLTRKSDMHRDLKEELLSDPSFSVREVRGILQVMHKKGYEAPTMEHFFQVFSGLNQKEEPLETFHALVDVFQPTPGTEDAKYTGRRSPGVLGGHYAGHSMFTSFKPWIDQRDLLQSFEELTAARSWNSYFEIMVNIVVKKHLIREDESGKPRVGALIPGMNDPVTGEKRWYRVQQAVVSGKGKLMYLLVPAHSSYANDMPIIRLYRNTSLQTYAMDSAPTVTRDLDPTAPPGYLYSDVTEEIDQEFIKEFSVEDPEKLEDAKNKRPIAFIGHSLGGSDAQIDICRFFSNPNRLPTHPIWLFAHSAPAIKAEDAHHFNRYLKENARFLEKNNVQFKLTHWIDTEDFIPREVRYANRIFSGRHLGYGLPVQNSQVKSKAVTFTKNRNGVHPEIMQNGPHFRRFGMGIKDRDVFKAKMRVDTFDQAQKEPLLFKIGRRSTLSNLTKFFWSAKRFFKGRRMTSPTEAHGVIRAEYSPT